MNNTKKWLLFLASSAMALPAFAQDRTLFEVYELALSNDAQYQAARYQYESVKQSAPIARSALLPQISGTAQTFENQNTTDSTNPLFDGTNKFNTTGYSLSLSQSIYRNDQWMNLKQANASVAQAEAEYKAALQDLIIRTIQAYFDVLASEDNLRFATAEREAVGRQLEQSQKRFEVGLIAITDVKESQASYDAAIAAEISAKNQINIAREALAVLTGEYIESIKPLSPDLPMVKPEPDDIQAWVDQSLAQNLSFLAAQMGAKASNYGVKVARSGHYPYLDLVASYDKTDYDYRESASALNTDRKTDGGNIGVQFTLPIYSGHRVSSQTAQAAANYNASLQNLEFSRRSTIQSARSSFLNVKTGISEVQALKQSLESSRVSAEATQAGFQVGTRTAVDVLLTLRTTFDAERNYALSRYNYILNYARLKQAAGTLTEQDIDTVDKLLIEKPPTTPAP